MFFSLIVNISAKQSTAAAPAPEKIEVFVNDKRVLVDPRLTVLQVYTFSWFIIDIWTTFAQTHTLIKKNFEEEDAYRVVLLGTVGSSTICANQKKIL